MNVEIIQSPLMQLNAPYPSGAYLKAFFSNLQKDFPENIDHITWHDFSIALFYKVFSKKGLMQLFTLTEKKALCKAKEFFDQGNQEAAFQLRRYVIEREKWETWIENIVFIVNGKSGAKRDICHEFIYSPFVPRGNRVEQFLLQKQEQGVALTIDDAVIMASLSLADLADYITLIFDENFSLVRYGESLAISTTSFADIEQSLSAPLLQEFYNDVVDDYITSLPKTDTLFCLSVPFPGTFSAALFTAKKIKQHFGDKALIAMGGGFINTEVRNPKDTALFHYVDVLSYDLGYGFYYSLLENYAQTHHLRGLFAGKQVYKATYLFDGRIKYPLNSDTTLQNYEKICVKNLVPDYSEIDFSLYVSLADDINPMHRLWTDGVWMKAYLAHGCYWHRCAFCDVQLDYVCNYRPVDVEKLYKGLYEQSCKKGVQGLHFVDEASPPALLKQFALMNCVYHKHFTYWGNIRFEKVFTRDSADFLAYSGLVGVSGGIEIATDKGLSSIDKGIDSESLVATCAALKEAGILVHGYMIYGFYDESPQDLINSMEILRQLFQWNLLDSAFWHKFVLTRHSRIFSEWEKGEHPTLEPVYPCHAVTKEKPFAENGLYFKGEKKSEKYTLGLENALNAWMHGESLTRNVTKWFSFEMPQPTVAKNFVEKALAKYEEKRDFFYYNSYGNENQKKYYWLGGKPLLINKKTKEISWSYFDEIFVEILPYDNIENLFELLWNLRPEVASNNDTLQKATKNLPKKIVNFFRGRGLVLL